MRIPVVPKTRTRKWPESEDASCDLNSSSASGAKLVFASYMPTIFSFKKQLQHEADTGISVACRQKVEETNMHEITCFRQIQDCFEPNWGSKPGPGIGPKYGSVFGPRNEDGHVNVAKDALNLRKARKNWRKRTCAKCNQTLCSGPGV